MKPKFITIEPYHYKVRVLRTRREKKQHDVPADALGMVFEHEGRIMVALPWRYDEGTVIHEAHHLARWINAGHEVPTSTDCHEIDAYLQEHIVREIKKVYRKK